MSDPLGLIGSTGGASPLQGPGGVGLGREVKLEPGAPSFQSLLRDNLSKVNELQQDASRAVEDLTAGRRDDVESVLMATQKADTAFRMLLQVRNQVMSAYQEISQIRV